MSGKITWQDYQSVKQANPEMFSWDLAKLLHVSEAELRQACIGHGVQRLIVNPMKLLTELSHLGDVLAVTDNVSAVNEITGSYKNPRIGDSAGMFLNPGQLDLRVFPKHWVSVFALEETMNNGTVWNSIQFFDEAGHAVHRIYAKDTTDLRQWHQLVQRYINNDATPVEISQPQQQITAPPQIPAEPVERYWREMVDVHQFPGLLKEFGLTRQQAFSLVSDDLARKVSADSAGKLLQQAHQAGNEIMIFTGSSGCVQIYTGEINKMTRHNDWLTLKGNNFDCHLKDGDIDQCWVVKKPTGDDFVTSLEFFSADGLQISQFYGSRREGQAEQNVWREQVNALE